MKPHRLRSCRNRFVLAGILAGLGGSGFLAATASAQEVEGKGSGPSGTVQTTPRDDRDDLDKRHAQWLAEVAAIITSEERDLVLRLTRDYQRDAFVRKFWQVRDPVPKTGRNEMRERWE